MDKMIKIDRTIDIPAERSGRPCIYPWSDLAVGDSFFMPHQHSPYSMVRLYNNKLPKGKRIKITRKLEGEGQRVWRIK